MQPLTEHMTNLVQSNQSLCTQVLALLGNDKLLLNKFDLLTYIPYFIHHAQHKGAGNGGTFYYLYTGVIIEGKYQFLFLDQDPILVLINPVDVTRMVPTTINDSLHYYVLDRLTDYFTSIQESCHIKLCKSAMAISLVKKAITRNTAIISGKISPECYDPVRTELYYNIPYYKQALYVRSNFKVLNNAFYKFAPELTSNSSNSLGVTLDEFFPEVNLDSCLTEIYYAT